MKIESFVLKNVAAGVVLFGSATELVVSWSRHFSGATSVLNSVLVLPSGTSCRFRGDEVLQRLDVGEDMGLELLSAQSGQMYSQMNPLDPIVANYSLYINDIGTVHIYLWKIER